MQSFISILSQNYAYCTQEFMVTCDGVLFMAETGSVYLVSEWMFYIVNEAGFTLFGLFACIFSSVAVFIFKYL